MSRSLSACAPRWGAWFLLAWSLALIVLLSVIWQLHFASRIEVNGGCGYDGYFYCAMANGEIVREPFSRRVLGPGFASLFEDRLRGFQILNTISILGLIFVSVRLTQQTKRGPETSSSRLSGLIAISVALLSVSVVLGARNLIHLMIMYPAVTDALAMFLMFTALLGLVIRERGFPLVVFSTLCALLAPMAREVFGLPLIVAGIWAALIGYGRRSISISIATAAALGSTWAMTRPSTGTRQNLLDVLMFWFDENFLGFDGWLRFFTMVALGMGFAWVPLLSPRFLRLLSPGEWILVIAATTYFVVSFLGGGDTDRILMPSGILLFLVLLRVGFRVPTLLPGTCLIVAAFIVAQSPFTIVGSGGEEWQAFFALRVTAGVNLLNNGLAPVLLGLPMAVAGIGSIMYEVRRHSVAR